MALPGRGARTRAAVAGLLCILLAQVPAWADTAGGAGVDGIERAHRLLDGAVRPDPAPGDLMVATPGAGSPQGTLGFADVHCASDPGGDTFVIRDSGDGEEHVAFAEPRADIRAVCGDYGPSLELRMRLATPTPPADWVGATGAYWYLDITGDGEFDRAVAVERGQDGPRTVVAERAGGGYRPLDGCSVQVTLDGGDLVARGLEPGRCLEAGGRISDRVAVGAVKVFETAAGEAVHDRSEHMFTVGRDGTPTLRTRARLAGHDRYATAVAISRERFTQPPAAAYLARADGFADALAAGSLDASLATRGPILLVPSCGTVPQAVLDELDRLEPPEVIALGGEAAVCSGVLAAVARAGDGRWQTRRLAGGPDEPTRFGTAVAVSRHAYEVGGVDEVYLATGDAFPDALAAGSLDKGPLLLVPGCGALPEAVRAELGRLAPGRVVALGGEAAVCGEVLSEALRAARGGGREVLAERLSGPTRLDTAAEISAYRFPQGAERAYVARADDFPDALAGAMLQGGPILLVPRCGDLPPPVARELRRLEAGEVVALGGRQAVCDQMLRHAANA